MRKKIGDIFCTMINDKYYFFQFIGVDKAYLYGDVVRIFRKTLKSINMYEVDSFDYADIIRYANIQDLNTGIKLKIFKKLSNRPLENNFQPPEFVSTSDNGKEFNKSEKWVYWKFGDFDRTEIGYLKGKYKKMTKIVGLSPYSFVDCLGNRWLDKNWPE